MFTISAFADEISPDPAEQVRVLAASGVKHIEFRSILGTNVLALTDHQIDEFKSLLDANGFALSAIGSPVGKVAIDAPFEPHLEKFRRAIDLAKKFGTRNIRVFSYYPPDGVHDWNDPAITDAHVNEVFARMARKAEMAEQAGLRMVHENEHRIYGDRADRVATLFEKVTSPALGAVYDAANHVYCGYDPWEGWTRTKAHTVHLHIKDWKSGEKHGAIPGEGDGRWADVLADIMANGGYTGYATMEPHLLGGGPTGGVTGPELFPKAIDAFRGLLTKVGATWN